MANQKKTILIGTEGMQGKALTEDAIRYAEAFRQERQMQFTVDRTEVLRHMDLEMWQVFSKRWNIAPPYPKGWGNETAQYAVMHKSRLMLVEFSEEEKRFSAAWLISNGFELPPGMVLEDGKLRVSTPQAE